MKATPLSSTADAFKALGHPTRLRIVEMLGSGALSFCQITAVLGGSPSTVSAHLSELSYAGLVEHERRGRFVTYRLVGGAVDRLLEEAGVLLAGDPQVRDDKDHAHRLRARGIRAVDWTDPCLEVEVGVDVHEPVRLPAREGEGT